MTHTHKQTPILSFNSVEEYNTTLTKVLEMTAEERLAWEKQQGFTSFVTMSEEIYDSILQKDITSLEQLKTEIIPYKNYVTLQKNESDEFSLEMNAYFRKDYYLANKNGILKINSTFYKFIDNSSISTDKSHLHILNKINTLDDITPEYEDYLTIEHKEVNTLKISSFYFCKDIKYHENTVTKGRNRTKLIVEIDLGKTEVLIGNLKDVIKTFEARCIVRAYLRTGGIWFHAKRTLSCHIETDIIVPYVTPKKQRYFFIETGKKDYSIQHTLIPKTIYTNSSQIPSFDYIYGWAKNPDSGSVEVGCNGNL